MIADTDTLSLAPGVALRPGELVDPVRGDSWPLNASGAFVLARAGRPLGQIVGETADVFSLSVEAARADVLRFVWQLNALALVNVDSDGSRLRRVADWIELAARLAPAGARPAALSRRRALDTRSVSRSIVSSLSATRSRVVFVAVVATAVAAQFASLAGASALAAPLALGLGTGAGLGFHEAAHVAVLRGVPSALVTRGRRTYVLHARVSSSRRSVVALTGPLAVAMLGLGLSFAGAILLVPLLTIAACPFAAHALALTVLSGDGRIACGL